MAIYKTGSIDILNPDGEPIDCIGNTVTQLNTDESREKAANNLRLIEELLSNSTDGIQLSEHAVAWACIHAGANRKDDWVKNIVDAVKWLPLKICQKKIQ